MKRIILYLVAALTLSSCGYNSLVEKDENIEAAWAKVETQYQRRADLIPNIVETVKGYADFEQETLTAVIEARSKATSIQVDPSNLTPESVANFQAAQGELSGALSRLLVSVERYPELKASQQFLQLQAQLEGTENRIAVSRDRFNEAVQDYQVYRRKFPTNITAGIFGFEEKGYFESEAGSEQAPKVDF